MSVWKKAVSTLATAGLLASLLGTAVAGTAFATPAPVLNSSCQTAGNCQAVAAPGSYYAITDSTTGVSGSYYAWTVSGGTFVNGVNGITLFSSTTVVGPAVYTAGMVGASDGTLVPSASAAWVNSSTAGTATITEWVWTSTGGNNYWAQTGNVYYVTFYGSSSLAVSAANSSIATVIPGALCHVNTVTGNLDDTTDTSGSATFGSLDAVLCVKLENGAGSTVSGATVSAVITPVGLVGGAQAATLVETTTGSGVYKANISGSGIAGNATISVSATTSAGTVAIGTKGYTFTGDLASLTATPAKTALLYNSSTPSEAVDFVAKDSAGNLITTTNVTATSSSTSILTIGAISQADPSDEGTVMAVCAGVEGKATVTVSGTNASGATISAAPVTVYCSGLPASFSLAFAKPTVLPGGSVSLTATALDSAGQPAAGVAYSGPVVSSGAVFNGTNNYDGTYTWTFLAPFNTGVVTAAATDASGEALGTQYASINVGTPVPVAGATIGSALGKTLVGPFTTVTKIAAKGAYVTFKMSFGSDSAGKTITIYKAAKVGTSFPKPVVWVKLTTRVANSSGDVYVYVTSGGAWLSIRGTNGTVYTPGTQAVWR